MNKQQHYISNELTHFVGRSLLTDEERYSLFSQIVRSGLLKGRVDNGKGSTMVNVDPNFDFSGNEMYNPNIVCFCDIPEDDFSIHMDKYSHFGLAFSKDMLVSQGARPVLYIPEDTLSVGQKISDIFNENVKLQHSFQIQSANDLIESFINTGKPSNSAAMSFFHFLDLQLLSYVKFYNHNKADNDPDNYYMEREWRSLERIEFQLNDIKRVILPYTFANRFYKDFPDYNAQIRTV